MPTYDNVWWGWDTLIFFLFLIDNYFGLTIQIFFFKTIYYMIFCIKKKQWFKDFCFYSRFMTPSNVGSFAPLRTHHIYIYCHIFVIKKFHLLSNFGLVFILWPLIYMSQLKFSLNIILLSDSTNPIKPILIYSFRHYLKISASK